MSTKDIFRNKHSEWLSGGLWLLLPTILILTFFAFIAYNRIDKFATEYSNTSDECLAYRKVFSKQKLGCSFPVLEYSSVFKFLDDQEKKLKISYDEIWGSASIDVFIINKSDYPSLRDTRLNFQKYYNDYPVTGFENLIMINDSVYTSEIKLLKTRNLGWGPFVKTGKCDPEHGDLWRPKYDSIYVASCYLYYKKWIYQIKKKGLDASLLRKKVINLRNSFDFSEAHLKETAFRPQEAVTITSAISLLLLACLLAGYWRVRRSSQSRAAKAVYLLHVLCLFIVLAVFLSLPDICFTSWMRGGLLCLLFSCLGIGILLSMYHKALHKCQIQTPTK